MKMVNSYLLFALVLISLSGVAQIYGATTTCLYKSSPCYYKPINCPNQCPSTNPSNPKDKACYVDCSSPKCEATCKKMKPDCEGTGAACHDPRFIGGDGIVFYFHGKTNEHFTLVSDRNLQINSRFIGLRPAGRTRDFTWIQALGLLFDSSSFTAEAIKSATWDQEVDHLKFSYNGTDLVLPEGYPAFWESPEGDLRVERTSIKNSVLVTIPEIAEISLNVAPITKEDDRIHNYRIPSNDCFAHLEVQFKFYSLSSDVEGVLGRTYQPDFKNPAKLGVEMAVVGGEDKYRTESLVSTNCKSCVFSPGKERDTSKLMLYGTLDCTSGSSSGNGIVCRK